MASKTLFNTILNAMLPKATAVNQAGGRAYEMSPQAALAQLAVTGCLNSTFYATDADQLKTVLDLATRPGMPPAFVAKVAIYARDQARMKDMPALLCAVLSVYGPAQLTAIFHRVIDDAKMLRNFVQIMRSGQVGRKSLGSLPKRLVQQWFDRRTDEELFRASVGTSPSLADVIKMVHPKPTTPARAALQAYLIGRAHDEAMLPEIVKQYEAFKKEVTP
jgi:60 kDa SS-A/Ro ribonucleoprotein